MSDHRFYSRAAAEKAAADWRAIGYVADIHRLDGAWVVVVVSPRRDVLPEGKT